MKIFLILIYVIGGTYLVMNLPQLLWGINYEIIFNIATNESLQTLSEILNFLNLTTTTARQWAINKLTICGGTGLFFILASIFTALIPSKHN